MVLNLLASMLFCAALFVVGMNWSCVFLNFRNRRRGIDKHHSMVPVVAQVLLVIAAQCSRLEQSPWLPTLAFWILGLADISLWMLASLPFVLLYRKYFQPDRDKTKTTKQGFGC